MARHNLCQVMWLDPKDPEITHYCRKFDGHPGECVCSCGVHKPTAGTRLVNAVPVDNIV